MSIEISRHPSSKGDITLVKIVNASGASVTLSSLGAGIVSVVVPDAAGRMTDVALGYADPADYLYDGPCAGKIPGRYANRIARGRFTIDDKEYTLAVNNGPNALHGGPEGFQNQIWTVAETSADTVVFTLHSPDGDEGYPGNLDVEARYHWDDSDTLTLTLRATTDAATVINLTNHCYWNLDGEGPVLDHELTLGSSAYLPTDSTLIPTGEIAPVAATPMDFTTAKPLGRDIKADFPALNYGKGYDNCWVVDGYRKGELRHVATLVGPRSGRQLDVATTQPAVQVYTGNWLEGCPAGKDGHIYHDYDGVAIECQGMPDAPNHPSFPSQLLTPGDTYQEIIQFSFTNTHSKR